jgi:hypothetical protein
LRLKRKLFKSRRLKCRYNGRVKDQNIHVESAYVLLLISVEQIKVNQQRMEENMAKMKANQERMEENMANMQQQIQENQKVW